METHTRFKRGDFVEYYDGGYRYTHEVNEYGDREVEDWHITAYGRVLACNSCSALVMFHTHVDEEIKARDTIMIFEVHVIEVRTFYLEPIAEPARFKYKF